MPVFNNALAGAASGGAAGYTIERSLRFNSADSAHLSRQFSSGTTTTFTISFWVKRTEFSQATYLIAAGTGTQGYLNFDAGIIRFWGVNGDLKTNALYRDPSAWYHIVAVADTTNTTADDRMRLYVNGVRLTNSNGDFATHTQPSSGQSLGDWNSSNTHYVNRLGSGNYENFYLTEFHFVDGQALAATDFGEYDDNNVWQPAKFNGSHGTNGFHLDFSDTSSASAIGTDSSGNGNNWTVNNLSNVVGNGNWISQVVTTGGNRDYSSSYGVPQMFDNSTSTEMLNGGGTSSTWTPVGGLAFSSSFKMAAYDGDGGSITFNWSGGSYTWTLPTSNNTYPLTELSSYLTSPLTSITWSTPNIQGPYVYEVQVDGVRLVDNQYTDTDVLRDSPTNYEADSGNNGGNYCTMNPLRAGVPTNPHILSNGNLDIDHPSSAAWSSAYGTIAASSGKWYWEQTWSEGLVSIICGIGNELAQVNNYPADTHSLGYYFGNGDIYTGISGLAGSHGTGLVLGDVLGVALDVDAGTVDFYKNGSKQGSTITHNITGHVGPLVSSYSGKLTMNFGQRPFAYTPPTGYKSLCTQNLPDPLIADGSTAFNTRIWSGDANTSRALTGLNMAPDLVWIKKRSGSFSHYLFDSVRGNTKQLKSDLPEEESTTSNKLLSFDSDGFTVGNAGATNGLGDTYVGWAWDGGDLATNSAYNQSDVWSSRCTGTIYNASLGYENAFDGSTSTGSHSANGNTITFTPATAISVSSSIKIYYDIGSITGTSGSADITINGTSYVATAHSNRSNGHFTVTGVSSITSMVWERAADNDLIAVKAIEVDGKMLVDAGVIPVGSLNSSVYNQDQVWSTYGTFTGTYTGSYDWEGVFSNVDTYNADGSLYLTTGTGKWTLTSSITCNSEFKFYCYDNTSITLNEGLSSEVTVTSTGGSTFHYQTIPFSGQIHSVKVGSAATYLIRLFVDGKALIDSGITPTSVPSIASTVRANPTAGFSIATFSMPSVSTATIAHGLNAAPAFYVWKDRDSADSWYIYHSAVGADKWLSLNATSSATSNTVIWNNADPTSAVINTGSTFSNTGSTLVYAFSPVKNYSAFGSYTGNGSTTNGSFVFLDFTPALVIIKNTQSSGSYSSWGMWDSARNINAAALSSFNDPLWANRNVQEGKRGDGSGDASSFDNTVHLLSNGFQVFGNGTEYNNTNVKYVYAAWAENPFKTARAR